MSEDQTEEGPRRGELAAQSKAAAARRMQNPGRWAETQVEQAIREGKFDDLPGAGRPIENLGAHHDPDWWVKQLVEREQLSLLPPALAIRQEDAALEARLDRMTAESEVRRTVEEFNEAVRKARYQPLGGPPMITRERDADAEVTAWQERLRERRAVQAERMAATRPRPRRRRWWWQRT